MRVTVLFFGVLRDIAGRSEDSLELPDEQPLASVLAHYAGRFPALQAIEKSIVLARNRHFSQRSDVAREGDEIAFLPPVSGGSSGAAVRFTQTITDEECGHFFGLTREPIDSRELSARLLRGEDGAIVNFEGVVRNNTKGRRTLFLDYECYEPMAIETMAQIGRDLAGSYAVGRIGMLHRLGRMEIGETSVAIAVTAPHRRPAFDAALEAINRLKRTVPIWKKEHFADGEVWVDGEWDESILGR